MIIPFGIQSYQSDSLPWSGQRLVNWYAETAIASAKAKTPLVLLPRPGMVLQRVLSDGGVRGACVMGPNLYVCVAGALYKVNQNFHETLLGAIPGTAPVTMDENGLQVCVVTDPDGYIATPTTLTKITDEDWPGASSVTQLDGYFIFAESGDSGRFFLSDLYNGLSFQALDFATAESNADPIVRAFQNHQEVLLFGTLSIEPWADTGAADFPFERNSGAIIERGCGAKFSIVSLDNTVFWLGDDLIFYRLNGYNPMRVSTHPIELKVEQTPDPSDIRSWTYTKGGHTFYVATSLSGDWTLALDIATGLWAECSSQDTGFWRPMVGIAYNMQTVVGDYDRGRIYTLEIDAYDDDGDMIRHEAVSPPLANEAVRLFMSGLQIDFDTGEGLAVGQGSNPQAMLQWSDDGGRTWSSEHWRPMGRVGEYKTRVIWRRLGQFRERSYKVVVSDPIKCVLKSAYGQIVKGAT